MKKFKKPYYPSTLEYVLYGLIGTLVVTSVTSLGLFGYGMSRASTVKQEQAERQEQCGNIL